MITSIHPQRQKLLEQLERVDKNRDFVTKSKEIARIAHAGQTRFSGKPYFTHLEEVAGAFNDYSDKETAVCWLHDAPQKTYLICEDLVTFKIPVDIIEAADVLTPEWGVPYFDEIENIVKVPLARRPKQGDNISNMDEDRMPPEYEPSWKMRLNWDFQYPLSIAFIQAVLDGKILKTSTIVDYVKSNHCDDKFKGHPNFQMLTSHPV